MKILKTSNRHMVPVCYRRHSQFSGAIGMLPIMLTVATSGFPYNLQQQYTHTKTARYDLDIFRNEAIFRNYESANLGRVAFPPKDDRETTSAPIWLVKRMQASLKRRPPTLREVRAQFNASAQI